jgi:H+/Cl- antiporter ClcA
MAAPTAPALARLAVPAAGVGVGAALCLIALGGASEQLEELLWDVAPGWFGLDGTEAAWILGVLTAVGVVTAVLVLVVPGHAGPDPATQSLVSPPLPVSVLPGLALVVVVALGGGVSLGPENPIIAINVALALVVGHRLRPSVEPPQWVGFAAAGTIGAMFATPVAAALILVERPAGPSELGTWDRLFAPLVAGAAGALTMYALGRPVFAVDVAPYPGPSWEHLVSGPAVAVAGVAVGLVLVALFRPLHDLFWRLPTAAMLVLGGFVLGVLGAVGGAITLFKGLDQMQQLVAEDPEAGRLAAIIAVKGAALLVAATSGFRGGKIFPATFVGVAIGMLAHHLVDDIPLSLAVGSAVLGIVLVVSRSGFLSLFLAATIVGDVTLIPVLCIALLPAWLLVTDRPEMELEPEPVGSAA